jgi:hypothetical protein
MSFLSDFHGNEKKIDLTYRLLQSISKHMIIRSDQEYQGMFWKVFTPNFSKVKKRAEGSGRGITIGLTNKRDGNVYVRREERR